MTSSEHFVRVNTNDVNMLLYSASVMQFLVFVYSVSHLHCILYVNLYCI